MIDNRTTNTKLVIFNVPGNTSTGDAELLRAAADWLERNSDYTLVDLAFHEIDNGKNTELRVYFDP